jgi:diaminohydroxyphosphoribosylaminopyrimidine deaminase/5-amino-6-(5-phosphoribosylamino)uracil reductase
MGILVGTTTARIDNPQLTVREARGPNPVRVAIDAHCSLPSTAHLLDHSAETIIFNATRNEQRGLTSWVALNWNQCVLSQVLAHLYHQRRIISVIIEGGAATLTRCIAAQLWDEARVFISPSRFGAGIAAPRLPIPPHSETASGHDILRTTYAPALARLLGGTSPPASTL